MAKGPREEGERGEVGKVEGEVGGTRGSVRRKRGGASGRSFGVEDSVTGREGK